MPSDGALIIDTGLNNNGLIRDRKQFKSALDMMVKAAQNAGMQMAKGANAYTQAISKSRSATKGLTGEQAAIQKEIAKTEAEIEKLQERQREWDAMGFRPLPRRSRSWTSRYSLCRTSWTASMRS